MWGLDLEYTCVPRGQVPEPVCASISTDRGDFLIHAREPEFWPAMEQCLRHEQVSTMGNDLHLLANAEGSTLKPLVYDALQNNRIHSPLVTENLIQIARGTFHAGGKGGLAACVSKYFDEEMDKSEDTWRERYGELLDVPKEQFPQDAIDYALKDSRYHRLVALAQIDQSMPIDDRYRQARAEYVGERIGHVGMKIDHEHRDLLEASLEEQLEELRKTLGPEGLDWVYLKKTKGEWKWSKREKLIKQWVYENIPDRLIRRTKTDAVSLDKEACPIYSSIQPEFEDYSEYVRVQSLLSRVIPGFKVEGDRVHTRYSAMVTSGRYSCGNPALMNLSTEGGFRECMIAEEDNVFVSGDFVGHELGTFSQGCLDEFGWSKMAEAINAGMNVHTATAAAFEKISYEQAASLMAAGDPAFAKIRKVCKILNLGLLGGMGETVFCAQSKAKYGVEIPDGDFWPLKNQWKVAWPEVDLHFQSANERCNATGTAEIWLPRSQRLMGGLNFKEACSARLQPLASDMLKDACWEISKQQELDSGSWLYGSAIALTIHDEILIEGAASDADEIELVLAEEMNAAGSRWTPDVKTSVDTAQSKAFTKS